MAYEAILDAVNDVIQGGSVRTTVTESAPVKFSNAVSSLVTVNTSTLLLASNPNRLYAHFANNTGSTLWIQYSGPAAIGRGIQIPSNSILQIKLDELFTGAVYGAVSSGPVVIDVLEGT